MDFLALYVPVWILWTAIVVVGIFLYCCIAAVVAAVFVRNGIKEEDAMFAGVFCPIVLAGFAAFAVFGIIPCIIYNYLTNTRK